MPVARLALLLSAVLMAVPSLPLLASEPAPSHPDASNQSQLPFVQPRTGLYTAGQPTAEQLAQAAVAGVTTVIDLRGEDEERGFDEPAAAAWLGLRYIALPVPGGEAVTTDKARELHALLAAAEGPVLLHCASGNRAGALLALAAAHVDGADNASALALGRAAGLTSLAPVVEKQLPGTDAALPPAPDDNAGGSAESSP